MVSPNREEVRIGLGQNVGVIVLLNPLMTLILYHQIWEFRIGLVQDITVTVLLNLSHHIDTVLPNREEVKISLE